MNKPAQKTLRLLNEASAAHRQGDLVAAERGYRTVLKHNPREPDALHLLGLVLDQRGDTAKAADLLTQATGVRPAFAVAWNNLGNLHSKLGDAAAAERAYLQAVTQQPDLAGGYHNLGLLYLRTGRPREAAEALARAARLDPRVLAVHLDLAAALEASGEISAALRALQQPAALFPQDRGLARRRADLAFKTGDLREGWRLLEKAALPPALSLPLWQGEDLAGRGLLVTCSEDLGETLLLASLLPSVIAGARRCVVLCPARLVGLFRRSFPGARIVDVLQAEEVADVTFQAPLARLGAQFLAERAAFPPARAYLQADAALVEALRARYRAAATPPRLLVGMAWRSVAVADAAVKNVGLGEWGPVLNVPGTAFVNLQYGDSHAAIEVVRQAFSATILEDPAIDPMGDLDVYAAQIAALDLVVTSSSVTAHLAGALGVETVVLVPRTLGRRWYWFSDREMALWYARVRLVAAAEDGSWPTALRIAGLTVLERAMAIGAVPDPCPFLRALADGFEKGGRTPDAEAVYAAMEALTLPTARAWGAYGAAGLHKKAGRAEEALAAYDRALASDPTLWPALNEKGVLLNLLNRPQEAIAAYETALGQAPDAPEVHNNLGTALRKLGFSARALGHFDRALAVRPDLPAVLANRAAVLDDLGRFEDSLAALDELIAQEPDNVDYQYNRSLTLLTSGQLAAGWPAFAWRLKRPVANVRYDRFPVPRWRGESLADKNLLIWTEQGIGDEILTASMVPDALRAAKSVTLLCSARLVPLLRRSLPDAIVDLRAEPLPARVTNGGVDIQMSLGDLGTAFRSTFADFARSKPFLKPDLTLAEALRVKYRAAAPGNKVVGLSWSSAGNFEVGLVKGAALMDFAPILRTPGVTFVNLQYGDCAAEIAAVEQATGAHVLQDKTIDPLRDMDAFAAQVAAMDLVISVSNTTVHTAGALGVPAWVLMSQGRGRIWYWFWDRSDSPWYGSVRLFRRQPEATWEVPVAAIAAELRKSIAAP